LYVCWRTEKKINAGANATLNIVGKLGYEIKIIWKIESYHVTHNGGRPVKP
jgi:hypothetical protein